MDSLEAPTSWSSKAATSTTVDDTDTNSLPDAMLELALRLQVR